MLRGLSSILSPPVENHKEKRRIPPQGLIEYHVVTGSTTSDGDDLEPE